MEQLPLFKSAKAFSGDSLRYSSVRGLLLHLLTLGLIPAVIIGFIKGHVGSILINSAGFGLYCLSAMLLRKGLAAENPNRQHRLQAPSRWPFKLLAALLVAGTTGLLAFISAHQAIEVAVIYALGALLGMYLSYGFDQRQTVKLADAQGYSGEEIRQTLATAFETIKTIEQANRKILNRELNQRINTICGIAEGVIAELEADPRGIRRARKFLNIYLDSVQQVVEGYAKTHIQAAPAELEQNFKTALDTIESAFQEQRQKLLEEDMFDLDVKIEVLTTQLKHDGIM
jgi:5-bromo-4-chloroindolyl phosphate hydrolysis protein